MAKAIIAGGGSAGAGSDDCTATKDYVLSGYTAVTQDSDDEAAWGTMPNVDYASSISLTNTDGRKVIPGNSCWASVTNTDGVERTLIQSGKKGYITERTIFGVPSQWKTVTPSVISQTVAADDGKLLKGVGINPIPDQRSDNPTSAKLLAEDGKLKMIPPKGWYDGSSWYTWDTYALVAERGGLTAAKLMKNQSAFGISGTATSDANATAAVIRSGYTAWANGSKITGTLAIQSAISFSAAALSFNTIRISWTNPAKGPWQGIFIQMSASGTPGTGGGSRVYTGSGMNPNQAGGSNYVDIGGLTPGTTYYFTCTSYVDALGWGSSYNVSTATSAGLSIGQMISSGYFYKSYPLAYNAFWTQTDSDPGYGYNVYYVKNTNNPNVYGENAVWEGVAVMGGDYALANLADAYSPGHTTFLLFANSNDYANAAVACIKSRYTKIGFEGRSRNNITTIISDLTCEFTIKSVTNKGLISSINYAFLYGATKTYWYPHEDSSLRDKYLVEITTDNKSSITQTDDGRYWVVHFYS